ncbi:unnamed protein product [Brassica oleracea var. botrytis]
MKFDPIGLRLFVVTIIGLLREMWMKTTYLVVGTRIFSTQPSKPKRFFSLLRYLRLLHRLYRLRFRRRRVWS